MGLPKGKKPKRKEGIKVKKSDSATSSKSEKKNNTDEPKLNITEDENSLSTLFRSDELHELRKILKMKDLTNMPLILGAVILTKFDVVKKLIKQGYDVNVQAVDNSTPLMWAVMTKNFEMIDMLVSRGGADLTQVDSNGDNVMFIALNSNVWDENSYVEFFNQMKRTHEISMSYCNKSGNTMLHLAVKRQWTLLVESLMDENVTVDVLNNKGITPLIMAAARNNEKLVNILMNTGAQVLHEDNNGCTAVCYAITNIVQRKLKPPYSTLEHLTRQFGLSASSALSYENYIRKRLHLLISPPNTENTSYYLVINKVTVSIIRFFMKKLPNGPEILLDIHVFEKLKEALERHKEHFYNVQAILNVIATVVRWCSCCVGAMSTSIGERELSDIFINERAANACLWILTIFAECPKLKELLPSALLSIFVACGGESQAARDWLRAHRTKLEPFYLRYLDICLVNFNINEDGHHIQMVKQKLKSFKCLYKQLKDEELRQTTNNLENPTQDDDKVAINENITQEQNEPEQLNHGRKYAKRMRRKARALRARIDKIRSADIVERRLLNTVQQSVSDTELPVADDIVFDRDIGIMWRTNSNNTTSDEPNSEAPSTTNSREIIEIKLNHPANISSTDSINVFQDISNHIMVNEISIEYLNENNIDNTKRSRDSDVPLNEELLNFEIIASNVQIVLDDNTALNAKAQFGATISQLKIFLNDIIAKYEYFWDKEAKMGHPKFLGGQNDNVHSLLQGTRIEQLEKLKSILPYIEQQNISKLVNNFNLVIAKIEHLFSINDLSYKVLIEQLKNILLNHEIRGEKVFKTDFDHDSDELMEPDNSTNYGAIGDHLKRPTYMELIENVLPERYQNKELWEITQDELFVREMALLSTKFSSSLTTEDIEKIKKKTEDNAYHLVQSVFQICDTDSAMDNNYKNADMQKELFLYNDELKSTEEEKKEKNNHLFLILSPSEHKHILALHSKSNEMKSLSEVLRQNPIDIEVSDTNMINVSKNSRWENLIRSLQNLLKNHLVSKGATSSYTDDLTARAIYSCPADMRSHYTIATGGNFGNVEIALDRKARPLAVKRIHQRNTSVCHRLIAHVTQLLTVKHDHLLQYISCARDVDGVDDVCLATPLCEYNLGEYLMCLKFQQDLEKRQYSVKNFLIEQLLAGLQYLHDYTEPVVVHGNLKPSNILIDIHGNLRLAEFGIYQALYQNAKAPKSSMIWFARETYEQYEQLFSVQCTKASDIQVTGMLVHFILTRGLHPFGLVAGTILSNLVRGMPHLQITGCEINDLISWMLVYEHCDRPTIQQVLNHVYFWDGNKKWRFLLSCCGITETGAPLPELPLQRFHDSLDVLSKQNNVEGDWVSIIRKSFPNLAPILAIDKNCNDTPTGLLRFIRACIEQQQHSSKTDLKKFFLMAFPALPLSLFRLIENTEWMSDSIFSCFGNTAK